jgi:hypothetical protein
MTRSIASCDTITSLGDAMGKDEMTPVEVAREFDVSPATVRRWEAAGVLAPSRRLPGSKHRRYSKASVEALKKKLSTPEPDAQQ